MRSGIGNSATDPLYVTQTSATTDANGNPITPQGSVTNPTYERAVGSPSFDTTQAPSSVSPANALQVVAARSGRRSVTFTNITGTQPVYFVTSAVATGVTTGFFLAGTAGATVTIATTAAVFATSPTAPQTLGVLETF